MRNLKLPEPAKPDLWEATNEIRKLKLPESSKADQEVIEETRDLKLPEPAKSDCSEVV